MKEQRKTPKLRFPGFTDDWEQRKLGDTNTFFTDGNYGEAYPKASDMTDSSTGIPFLTGGNLKNGRLDLSGANYITYEKHMKLTSGHLSEDDIVIAVRGSLGALGYVNKGNSGWNINSQLAILRTDKTVLIGKYLIQFLLSTTGQKELLSKQTGSALKQLPISSLKDIAIPITSIEEQERIGMYLQNLDNLITLHQRKCDAIKELKKGMLQKMFPKNGEKIPEVRFPGFTDDWEQRKLEDIYGSIGNAYVGTATPYYVEQGHFYLESNNIKDGQINHNSEIFINDEFYEKQKDKWLHTGDMVMVQSGHVGHAAVIPEELDNTAAHALIMFRNPKEEIEPYFLNFEYQTDKAKKKIENITTGNTIKHILASEMQNFIVDVPKYEEQKVIAGYFRNIDTLITLHQRKVEKLKEMKKGLLQQMFV